MRFRWWNSFNLLGVILIAVALIGALQGRNMMFDPGRESRGTEWIIYLVAGALMLINGFLPPAHAGEDQDDKTTANKNAARPAGNTTISGGATSDVRGNSTK